MKSVQFVALGVCVFGSLVSGAALAAPSTASVGYAEVSRSVSLAGLNLNSVNGRFIATERLRAAAHDVCGCNDAAYLAQPVVRRFAAKCEAAAFKSAMQQLPVMQQTALIQNDDVAEFERDTTPTAMSVSFTR